VIAYRYSLAPKGFIGRPCGDVFRIIYGTYADQAHTLFILREGEEQVALTFCFEGVNDREIRNLFEVALVLGDDRVNVVLQHASSYLGVPKGRTMNLYQFNSFEDSFRTPINDLPLRPRYDSSEHGFCGSWR
jgi:hypothetical protein